MRTGRTVPLVFAVVALLTPLSASAAPLRMAQSVTPQTNITGWGWVTARRPTTTDYTPAARDRGNSTGATDTVHRFGVGQYAVTFSGIENPNNGGTDITAALGTTPRFCTGGDIGRDDQTANVTIQVLCYDLGGEAADSQFSIVYSASGLDSGAIAYLWADMPTSMDYTPAAFYQFNSSDTPNTIHRFGTGSYEVTLPNMSATEGDVQVTTVGDANCRIAGWSSGTGAALLDVKCYSETTHGLSDQEFDLMYTDNVGMTGVSRPFAVYLFADRPTTTSYTPAPAYRYSSGMSPSIKRTGVGKYTAILTSMPKGGAASVTAVGTGKSRCQLTGIRTDATPQKIGVACFTPAGNPVDSEFTLSYTK